MAFSDGGESVIVLAPLTNDLFTGARMCRLHEFGVLCTIRSACVLQLTNPEPCLNWPPSTVVEVAKKATMN